VSPEKRRVQVTIQGRPYTLLATDDEEAVRALAHTVDELMQSISDRSPHAEPSRVAVLACLHLADRLRSLERDLALLKERVERKSGEFAGMLERMLEPGEEEP
jgi:cell division protein ZapA